MKINCKDCGHFKDNHTYGETTDDAEKIGCCMERNCDCDKYTTTPTTPEAPVTPTEGELLPPPTN